MNCPTVTVLCHENRPPGMADLEQQAQVRYAGAGELAAALPGAQVLFVWDFLSNALEHAWSSADSLEWVHVASAGVDRIMFPELAASEVAVTNSRGVFERPIAEYVLGCVLAFAKDLPGTLARQAQRHWEHRDTEGIAGRHVLVVGTGPIGRAVARMLTACGMTVEGSGRRSHSGDPDFGTVHAQEELHGILPRADYVIVAAPLTEQTRGMIGRTALARMKNSARLVNVGRGPVVVEDDLVDALRAGEIAGAALDVFTQEPLPASAALWQLPGVIVSPHMAGDATGWLDDLAAVFADDFQRWRTGRPLVNMVDKQLGYVRTT